MKVGTVQLGEMATVIGGYAFKSKDFVDLQGVPVVKIANITSDGVDLSDSLFLPDEFLSVKDKYHVNNGDVLISLTGSQLSQPNSVVGRVARYSYENTALLNQRVGKLIPNDQRKCDIRFIYYFLKQGTVTCQLAVNAKGSANQANISGADIERLRIPAFSIAQQHGITSILSAYDDLIENNRRRIQLLEQAARLLYKEWFVHLRFPGHEHVKITDGVPEGWERKPLSELCTDFRESTDPRLLPPETAYIGLEHIPRRSITLNEWGNATAVESNKFQFAEGNILFGKIRPYFHKVGFALVDGIASSDAIVIRPTESRFYHYILFLLSSDEFIALASKTVREGSKMPRADWKFLLNSKFKTPTTALLSLFSDTIEPICSQLRNLSLRNKQLTRARDLLLPRLINGEMVV